MDLDLVFIAAVLSALTLNYASLGNSVSAAAFLGHIFGMRAVMQRQVGRVLHVTEQFVRASTEYAKCRRQRRYSRIPRLPMATSSSLALSNPPDFNRIWQMMSAGFAEPAVR